MGGRRTEEMDDRTGLAELDPIGGIAVCSHITRMFRHIIIPYHFSASGVGETGS